MKQSSFKVFLLIKSLKNQKFLLLMIAFFIAIFCLPRLTSLASSESNLTYFYDKLHTIVDQSLHKAPKAMKLYVTAYSSNEDETDDSPCIAASGYNLCQHNRENVVACNFLPLGTKVKFPQLDPDQIYTVVDRMHERFNSRLDIWMTSKTKAKKFGIKYLLVEIYNNDE